MHSHNFFNRKVTYPEVREFICDIQCDNVNLAKLRKNAQHVEDLIKNNPKQFLVLIAAEGSGACVEVLRNILVYMMQSLPETCKYALNELRENYDCRQLLIDYFMTTIKNVVEMLKLFPNFSEGLTQGLLVKPEIVYFMIAGPSEFGHNFEQERLEELQSICPDYAEQFASVFEKAKAAKELPKCIYNTATGPR